MPPSWERRGAGTWERHQSNRVSGCLALGGAGAEKSYLELAWLKTNGNSLLRVGQRGQKQERGEKKAGEGRGAGQQGACAV